MRWAIHTEAAAPSSGLRDALEHAMLRALRGYGLIPAQRDDEPPMTPERRRLIIDAHGLLGATIPAVRPQMEAAIEVAVMQARAIDSSGEALVFASLYGQRDPVRLSVSVEIAEPMV